MTFSYGRYTRCVSRDNTDPMADPLVGVVYPFGSGIYALALHIKSNISRHAHVPKAHGAAVLSRLEAATPSKTFIHWLPRRISSLLEEAHR